MNKILHIHAKFHNKPIVKRNFQNVYGPFNDIWMNRRPRVFMFFQILGGLNDLQTFMTNK